MRVAIIDADLIGRKKHRFPNLVCEKISGYWQKKGAETTLITEFPSPLEWLVWDYDETYVSKVFTDTEIPDYITESEHVHLGGTGFYFDKAPPLPDEIEHHMPDYHLYDEWIAEKIAEGRNKSEFKMYTDYSLGFITRGCFRKCKFCVNQKYDRVFPHSPLEEFYDPDRKKICLLDDNFLGCSQWKPLLQQLIDTGKPFRFMQGMDERILTEEKAEMLFNANYDSDYTFAFDNIEDYDLIHKKLKIIQKYNKSGRFVRFYVLVGFKSTDAEDIENAFKRIELLFKYRCYPYIMRYMSKDDAPYLHSKYKSIYVNLARWCNQPSLCKKKSFREFGQMESNLRVGKIIEEFEAENPSIAERYFDMKFGQI